MCSETCRECKIRLAVPRTIDWLVQQLLRHEAQRVVIGGATGEDFGSTVLAEFYRGRSAWSYLLMAAAKQQPAA
ncbi:MAG: hypothetical protein H5T86_05025 [Armatimonadetes bacterium]|nr:hypothetical protein [Armatimonadota bacterium]